MSRAAAICQQPECPLYQVAGGDFSGLSRPLLIAAAGYDQLIEFAESECLITPEIQRLYGQKDRFRAMPDDKVLILLPGWHHHAATSELVRWWVEDLDRYTVALDWPSAPARLSRIETMCRLVAVAIGAVSVGIIISRII